MPRRSSAAGTVVTSRSSSQIRPVVGSIIRLTIRRLVVLPHPDGPTSTVICPDGATRSTPSTATVPSGNLFVTPSNRITTCLQSAETDTAGPAYFGLESRDSGRYYGGLSAG